jgi:hypothetical protein
VDYRKPRDNALLSFGTTADETVAQAIARLAKQLGWVWSVSGEAEMFFGLAMENPAPFNVCDGASADYIAYFPVRADTFALALANGMEISNRVVIHGGAKPGDEVQELFLANGVTRIYQLAHRNLIDITVLVNSQVVADGTIWWNTFDDRVVLVNYAEGWIWFVDDFLQNDDNILVIYRYWIRLEYEQRDETSIAQRRQVFTREISDPGITSAEQAAAVATQILTDYGNGQRTGSFEIWRLGLRAGHSVKLKFPDYGIDEEYTIRKMDCRIDGSNSGLVVYCEFGSQQLMLSQVVGSAAAGAGSSDDLLRWSQLGPLTLGALSSITDYIVADTTLAKQFTAIVDASSEDVELTLPPAITREGHSLLVVRVDTSAHAVTILPAVGETINGDSSLSVSNSGYAGVLCYSDGATWYGLEVGLGAADLSAYLLATGARTGAISQAQTFTNGIIGPSWRPASDSTTALQLKNASSTAIVTVDTSNARVGINNTDPSTILHVVGDTAVTSGKLGVGTTAADSILHGVLSDGATNTSSQLLTLSHNTSGSPAAGFGTSILFELESSTTEDRAAAVIEALWNTSTDASRKADLVFSAYDTSKREGMRIQGNGATAAIGFFGVTPVTRPGPYSVSNVTTDRSYDANATTIDEIADVLGTLIADLVSLGLLAQTGGE